MKIKAVNTLEQAQIVRMIRNNARDYMTGDNREISSQDQEFFYVSVYACNPIQLFLYQDEYESYIGYGMLRKIQDRWYATLALYPEFRAQGYGTEIYKHLCSLEQETWIEIFANNNPSLVSSLKAGFEIVDVRDKIITLKHTRL